MHQLQNTPDADVKFAFRDAALLQIAGEFLHARLSVRHLQIEPRLYGSRPVAHGAPVGDDCAVKSAFIAQEVKSLPVLRGILAVDAVIRAHHGDGLRLADDLKRPVIQLAKRALIDVARLMQAVIFQIVAAEMFEAYADAGILRPFDIRLCKHARKLRILRKIFKVAPVQRVPLDVHTGRQQQFHAAVTAVVCKAFAHDPCALRIPGICKRLNGGIGNGRDRERFSVLSRPLRPKPHGPVRHRDVGDLSVQVVRVPKIFSGQKTDLFLNRECCCRLLHVFFSCILKNMTMIQLL